MVAIIEKRDLRDFDWLTTLLAVAIACFGVFFAIRALEESWGTSWPTWLVVITVGLVSLGALAPAVVPSIAHAQNMTEAEVGATFSMLRQTFSMPGSREITPASGEADSPIAKRGWVPRSSRATRSPRRRAIIASRDPPKPDPTIARSDGSTCTSAAPAAGEREDQRDQPRRGEDQRAGADAGHPLRRPRHLTDPVERLGIFHHRDCAEATGHAENVGARDIGEAGGRMQRELGVRRHRIASLGDEIEPHPMVETTHTVTIEASAEEMEWLEELGQVSGGLRMQASASTETTAAAQAPLARTVRISPRSPRPSA